MLTLKEITAEENALRTRAYKYGKALDQANSARARLSNLEKLLADPGPDMQALEDIIAIAGNLPEGLVTRDNHELRHLVMDKCDEVLTVLREKRKQLQDSLSDARLRLGMAEAYLATFSE